jgi:hypothetical protein
MSELILDGGTIRNCTHNRAIMSIWQHIQHDHYWMGAIKDAVSHWRGLETQIAVFIQWPFVIILFPVLPFIRAWVTRREAIRDVATQGSRG